MTHIAKKDDGKEIRKVTLIGMAVNLVLTGLKFIFGFFGHSSALVADAIHSASDLITDIAILIGSKFWNSPPDADHPNGHRRFETLISIGIGFAIIGVAVFLAIDSISNLYKQKFSHPDFFTAIVALAALVFKELLFRYTQKAARKIRSQALEANAWHHRSDAFSSLPVFIAILLSLCLPEYGFIDSLGALLVSGFIGKSGYDIIKPGIHQVVDGAPDIKTSEKLKAIAANFPGVISVHNFRVRYIGNDLQVDLHIVVNASISLIEAHDLSENVEKALINSGENVVDAMVHIDPFNEEKLNNENV